MNNLQVSLQQQPAWMLQGKNIVVSWFHFFIANMDKPPIIDLRKNPQSIIYTGRAWLIRTQLIQSST